MALIKCPECNHDVSSAAKTCPNCGFSISDAVNETIRVKIDPYPMGGSCIIYIKDVVTKRVLAETQSGGIAEIHSSADLNVFFCSVYGISMLETVLSPKSGGKYRATWGTGFFSPKIAACSRVDVIDS